MLLVREFVYVIEVLLLSGYITSVVAVGNYNDYLFSIHKTG